MMDDDEWLVGTLYPAREQQTSVSNSNGAGGGGKKLHVRVSATSDFGISLQQSILE